MYDMGMKVAAVSVMCQDERVFEAMLNAGTPCPKDGLVGDKARLAWEMEAVKEEIKRDQNNPMRKIFNENVENLVTKIMSTIKEYERKIHSERIKCGMKNYVKNGGKLGRPKNSTK